MKKYDEIMALAKTLGPLTPKQMLYCDVEHYRRVAEDKCKGRGERKYMFTLMQVRGDWQIMRNFISYAYVKDRGKSITMGQTLECGRTFYNIKNGKVGYMSRKLKCNGRSVMFEQPMIIRTADSWSGAYWMFSNEGDVIPGSRLHRIATRNGLSITMIKKAWNDREVRTWGTLTVIQRIIENPSYETLIKSYLWRLVADGVSVRGLDLKPIMLMIRNKIPLSGRELVEWRDAIEMMNNEHIDWRNGKILREWRKWHDVAIARGEKRKAEDEKKRLKALEEAFLKIHGEHVGREWTDGSLMYHVLSSVLEYFEEGKAMHHCVYANKYYEQKDSIIISVSIDGKREATVEYNLKKRKVIQIRAKCNQKSEYQDEIMNSVVNNIEKVLAA